MQRTPAVSPPAAPYAERLSVPWTWWVGGLVATTLLGSEVWGGFHWHVALVVEAVFVVVVGAMLVGAGTTVVRVDEGALQAGGRWLPVNEITQVAALDARETRLRLGPAADPAAHLVTRGWIKTSVLVLLANPEPTPYWLVSTRRPDELVRAVVSAAATPAS